MHPILMGLQPLKVLEMFKMLDNFASPNCIFYVSFHCPCFPDSKYTTFIQLC